jgi:hypothetical protein
MFIRVSRTFIEGKQVPLIDSGNPDLAMEDDEEGLSGSTTKTFRTKPLGKKLKPLKCIGVKLYTMYNWKADAQEGVTTATTTTQKRVLPLNPLQQLATVTFK